MGLIPARSGSKGIPNKNIRLLGGKPLIAYTIEEAIKSKSLDDIIVSTNSKEIKKVAQMHGADVPFLRPMELATDESPTIDTIIHALNALDRHYDAVVLLQPTCPFRKANHISEAIRQFVHLDAETLISFEEVPHQYNPHWVFVEDENGRMELVTRGKSPISRRQDLPPAYIRNGAIYITRRDVILERRSLYGDVIVPYFMEKDGHFNLDTMEDWERAEDYLKKNP